MINTVYLCACQRLTIPAGADKMKIDNFKIKSADQFLSILSSGATHRLDSVPLRVAYFMFMLVSKQKYYDVF